VPLNVASVHLATHPTTARRQPGPAQPQEPETKYVGQAVGNFKADEWYPGGQLGTTENVNTGCYEDNTPAIEQQATDRAYRIGQQQDVTVYHLISQHTIEEKILRLHKTKRNLADSLLEGADMAHVITQEEMLNLLKEN